MYGYAGYRGGVFGNAYSMGVGGYAEYNQGVYGWAPYMGVYGEADTYGVYGNAATGTHAGYFQGNVYASGNVGIGTETPNSKLQVAGPIATAYTSVTTSTYTAGDSDSVIVVNAPGAATITLPTAAGCIGRVYTVKNLSSNDVDVVGSSSEPIDGQTAGYRLYERWDYVTVVSDGSTGWLIVAEMAHPSP